MQEMFRLQKHAFIFFGNILCWKRLLFFGGYSKYYCLIGKNCNTYSVYPLQIRYFKTSNCTKTLHTIKGWKSLTRDGQKEFMPGKSPVSCEDGNDAIPHLDIMNRLQDCNTVSDQIKTFCSLVSLTPEDVENRRAFCKSLAEVFRPYFSEVRVNLFGSSVNSLGFKGCDADISIQTIFNKEHVKDKKGLSVCPTLESVIQGETSAETVAHLPPRLLLRFVRRIIRQHCADVKEPILLIKARCPLLRFYNSKYDLFCDFSIGNEASLRNTRLLRLLSHLDERFTYLAKFIRYWGKYEGFVGDIDMFNSYAFSLLLVHFLQLRDPPVLPPIQHIIEKSEYLRHGDANDDELLLKDVKNFQKSLNSQTLEELLREYYFHYLSFDFSNVMVPLNSTVVPNFEILPKKDDGTSDKFEYSTVTVQDPFRQNFNVTMAAAHKSCIRFINGLVEACSSYQDQSVWQSGVDKWGLCSLFNRTLYDEPLMIKKWQENCIHTIKLPIEVDAQLVKNILQKCLLVECSELLMPKNNESLLLRFNCKVYYNTWQGRQYMYNSCPQSLTDPMEIEKWVSAEILKKKDILSKERKCLFTFLCECFKNEDDKELNVVLSFNESKCPPVAAIYLKEYIPLMCKKIMK